MYITRSEIKNIFNTEHRYSEAYEKAISLMRNNIGSEIDLDTEFSRIGETRNIVILSIAYNLTAYYMNLLGAKIDGVLYLERATNLMLNISGGSVDMPRFERRSDTDELITYQAYAPDGSSEDDPVWTITKITTTVGGIVSSTEVFTDEIWTDHLSL